MAAKIAFNAVLPAAAMLPLGGLIIWFGIGYGLRPLRDVTRQLNARKPDSLAPIAPGKPPSEIAPLIDALNALLSRLDHALQAERQFIADASHELRTPTTALRLQLDLLDSARTPAERDQAMHNLAGGVDRMQRLVVQILTLARLDPDNPASQEGIDLARCLEDVRDEFAHFAASKSIVFTLCINARPKASGELRALRALLANLVDNALRYTPGGGKVSITLETGNGFATVKVADSGPGIPKEIRDKVFARFFRGNGDANAVGTGLGLAIAKRAAERLRAVLELHDRPDGEGLIAIVQIPAAAD